MTWLDPQLLRQFARVSGLAFQGVAALLVGFAAGLGVDHLVPKVAPAGVIVGGLLGAAGSAYVMITGGRRLIEDSSATKEDQ